LEEKLLGHREIGFGEALALHEIARRVRAAEASLAVQIETKKIHR
jgi:hypothetical protein